MAGRRGPRRRRGYNAPGGGSGQAAEKPTWEDALEQGRPGLAVFRWLMWLYGGKWLRWLSRDTLHARMAASAAWFAQQHGIDPRWARHDGHRVRAAHRYILDIRQHLAHDVFGMPRDWRKRRMDYPPKTEEEILVAIATEQERQRMRGRLGVLAKEQIQDLRRSQVRFLREEGMSLTEIATTLEVDRSTIVRDVQAMRG